MLKDASHSFALSKLSMLAEIKHPIPQGSSSVWLRGFVWITLLLRLETADVRCTIHHLSFMYTIYINLSLICDHDWLLTVVSPGLSPYATKILGQRMLWRCEEEFLCSTLPGPEDYFQLWASEPCAHGTRSYPRRDWDVTDSLPVYIFHFNHWL